VITLGPATPDHAADLASRLRPADLAEIEAASGRPPADVLAESLDRALEARVALLDGRPIAIWGLGTLSMMFGPGVPWMVASPEIASVGQRFLRESRRQVAVMLGRYAVLTNHVDARNAPAIKYLRWLGFTFGVATPWGHAGLPFHPFHLTRDNMERAHV
jgi:hypothetical protein